MSQRSPIALAPRACANDECGKQFVPPHGHTRVCSPECRRARERAVKARRGQPVADKSCDICSRMFKPYRPHQETCSDPDCRKEAARRRTLAWNINHPGYYDGYWKTYYAQNRKRQLAAFQAWYQANREYAMAQSRAYIATHPDQRRETVRRYKQTERGRLTDLAAVHRRLARKRGAPGDASVEQLTARWNYYGGMCWMCGQPADQWDHVIALARGGSGWPSNLRPACALDNQSKGAKHWMELTA